jgi:hypothetical protein
LTFPPPNGPRYDAILSATPRVRRIVIGAAVTICLASTLAEAQQSPRVFVGAVAGISTLSADARSEITTAGADVSLYKPENGPALNVLFGVQVHEYVSLQGNYVWNNNDVVLTSVRAAGGSFSVQPSKTSQHALVGDVLAFFRDRRSALRPYLSVGIGVVRLQTRPNGEARARTVVVPPANARATGALLRVAVGIDVAVGAGWSARYSFSESISNNPLSAQLLPPGQRKLANFQNLFGMVRTF